MASRDKSTEPSTPGSQSSERAAKQRRRSGKELTSERLRATVLRLVYLAMNADPEYDGVSVPGPTKRQREYWSDVEDRELDLLSQAVEAVERVYEKKAGDVERSVWASIVESFTAELRAVEREDWDASRPRLIAFLADAYAAKAGRAPDLARIQAVLDDINYDDVHNSTLEGHRGPWEAARTIIGRILGAGYSAGRQWGKRAADGRIPLASQDEIRLAAARDENIVREMLAYVIRIFAEGDGARDVATHIARMLRDEHGFCEDDAVTLVHDVYDDTDPRRSG